MWGWLRKCARADKSGSCGAGAPWFWNPGGLYKTGECYSYPIENDLLINKPFSWEKLQIPETGANSVKALI